MKVRLHSTLALGLLVTASMMATTAQSAVMAVDLSNNAVSSGTISDGSNTVTFTFDQQQPSGTGVLDPFVRIQHNDTEQGYNTTQANAGALPFDDKFGVFTHDLLFSSMQAINGNYNFVLDIGEPANTSLLSLDGLRLYVTNTPGQNSSSVDGAGDASGISGTPLWDMDALADNYILLDANRNGKPGNGVSDMLMEVPTNVFAGVASNQYIILWSRFGLQDNAHAGAASFGTFEEWAQLTTADNGGGGPPTGIPEPGSISLLAFGLLGLVYAIRRKSRH